MSVGFSIVPTGGFVPMLVNFVANTVANATSYDWVFDAANLDLAATATGQSISHGYISKGGKTVTLNVTLVDTSILTLTKTNCVQCSDFGVLAADFDGTGDGLIPPANLYSGPAPFTVIFTGIQNPYPSPTIHFRWDFGDGTFANVDDNPNCAHVYTVPGVYSVSLTATSLNNPNPPWFGAGPFTFARTNYLTVT